MKLIGAMLALILAVMIVATTAFAQAPTKAPEDKIDELVRLLRDPELQAALAERRQASEPPIAGPSSDIAKWEAQTRTRVDSVLAALPRIPSEIAAAAIRTRQDALSHGYAPVFLIFAGLVAIGLVAERLYLHYDGQNPRPVRAFVPVIVFAGCMAAVFFAVDWPPLARIVLLVYLTAFAAFRIGSVLIGLTVRQAARIRARIFLAVTCIAIASAVVGPPLSVDAAVTNAISYLFSLVMLGLAIETAVALTSSARSRWTHIGLCVLLWLLWCFDLRTIFWLGVFAIVLPPALRSVGRSASGFFQSEHHPVRSVLVGRGARAAIVALAMLWLAFVWRMNPDALGHGNPFVTALFYGLLKSVVVVLLADLVWQLARNWIDGMLSASQIASGVSSADAARRARYRTLLPILRNALAAFVAVFAGLIVLAELGIEIGPLIAGAGIFGVALGFGSQTLVKDVISGVFYMLDDAFRVGEYIQAKSYKGTVEGFSLRSVRLRHHRGPVFTVPFGELGAVENMSRDWVIDKFRISVGYDTDVEKARKLVKKIGTELSEDPELGPLFIQPLKMKGVEEFGDYGIVLSFAMTTVPGMQTYIRRKAHVKIREAFRANDIEFAQPMVNVGGDEKDGGAAAAAAIKAQQAKAAAAES